MDNEKPIGLPPIPPFTAPVSNELSRMAERPPRTSGHRRAHSEIPVISDDLGAAAYDGAGAGGFPGAGGNYSDETEEDLISLYIDMDKAFPAPADGVEPLPLSVPPLPLSVPPFRGRHHHSFSMDGFSMFNSEMFNGGGGSGIGGGSGGGGGVSAAVEARKALSAAKLAELAITDPKRAKRMWANRLSAQRSKERKSRYMAELERKVQNLQTEATSLSAQLTLLQNDTKGLSAENTALKLRLQTAEQQVRLQDALNNALREETQRLKMLSGQTPVSNNNGTPGMMNFPASFGSNNLFFPNNPTMQNTLMTTQEFQQLHIQCQKRQQHQFQLQQFQQQQFQQQHQPGPSMPSSKEDTTDSKSSSS